MGNLRLCTLLASFVLDRARTFNRFFTRLRIRMRKRCLTRVRCPSNTLLTDIIIYTHVKMMKDQNRTINRKSSRGDTTVNRKRSKSSMSGLLRHTPMVENVARIDMSAKRLRTQPLSRPKSSIDHHLRSLSEKDATAGRHSHEPARQSANYFHIHTNTCMCTTYAYNTPNRSHACTECC